RIGSHGVAFVGWFEGERLVSVAGARRAEAWIARRPGEDEAALVAVRVPMGIIGAVATTPDFRGKGLATQAVAAALGWLEGQGALFQVLWGAEHDLYRRLGFELCGEQMRVPLGEYLRATENS